MTASLQAKSDAANRYFELRYPGYRLDDFVEGPSGRLTLILKPKQDGCTCPHCGSYCTRFHDSRTMTIRDWDMLGAGVVDVVIGSRRIRCRCGCKRTEATPDWVLPKHRITKRLAGFVQFLTRQRICVQDIVKITGVGWNLARELDEQVLEYNFGQRRLAEAKHLAIDEISIR